MKIFVTVGTQNQDFQRIFDYVDKYTNEHDEVITQTGKSKFQGTFKFSDKIDKYMKESDLIITHGGVASIMESLFLNKKIIVVPRMKKYGEHVDDHQLEICTKFNNEGYVLMATNDQEFNECIMHINDFKPKKYLSTNKDFNIKLNEMIGSL